MCTDNFHRDFLYPLLDKVNKEKKSLILMGNFNISLLNSDNNKSVSNLLGIFGSFSLLPQIIFPTRVTNFSKILIIYSLTLQIQELFQEFNLEYF